MGASLSRRPYVSRMNDVDNCGMGLAWECPMRWTDLEPTGAAGVRSCLECKKEVFVCTTRADFQEHAGAGRCVAIPAGTADDDRGLMVGWPDTTLLRGGYDIEL